MKNRSLLLIIGISTLFGITTLLNCRISSRQNSSVSVFHTMKGDAESKEYSIEELVDKLFKNREVSIKKISDNEFYINDSAYYLSYVNGDISYSNKKYNKNYQTMYRSILYENSLETVMNEYDTNEIAGITREQALEKAKSVVNKLGLEIDEEPSLEQRDDCYYILWNNALDTPAYKAINDNSNKYRSYSEANIGNTILAVVTKDGVIELEISKVYGSLEAMLIN